MPSWEDVIANHRLVEETASWEFWDRYLADHPDTLNRILADLYQVTTGAKVPASLEELWGLVAPSYATDEFPVAVKRLLNGRSVRWLARQIGVTQPYMHRLLTGEKPIISIHDPKGSMRRLELVAKALRVHPSHFAEWRRLWAMSLIDTAFASQPNLSIAFFKKFSGLPNSSPRAHQNVR